MNDPIDAAALLLAAVEVVVGRVRHLRLFAHDVARLVRGLAAHRVEALDEGHAVEDAGTLVAAGFQQQPGDGVGVRHAGLVNRADHGAAAVALPARAGEVGREYARRPALVTGVLVQHRVGGHELPGGSGPAVDLDADAEA